MFELGVRAGLAAAVLGGAWMFGASQAGFLLQVLAVFAAYSVFGFLLERRGLKNAGVAGFFASADALAIALILGSFGAIDSLGFLVILPCAYAASRYGSLPSATAPMATAWLFLAQNLMQIGPTQPLFYAQAVGVLAVGLLMNHRRIVVTVTREIVKQVEPLSPEEPEAFLELRENFRKLRDLYRDLERKSRRDRHAALLLETRFPEGDRFFQRLAVKLQALSGAESLTIYTIAQFAGVMVVRATAGDGSNPPIDHSLSVDPGQAPNQLRETLRDAAAALLDEHERGQLANVLLTERGRVIGMICIRRELRDRLDESTVILEELAPLVAELIGEEARRDSVERRLRETELLYDAATVVAGADTATLLASRVARELHDVLDVDHVGVFLLDGEEALPAAVAGRPVRLLEKMSFAMGAGIGGWLRMEAPEVWIPETLEDARCPAQETLKSRIGSFCLIPLQYSEQPVGFLTAACSRSGGIDVPDLETLRVVGAEMSRALARLGGESSRSGLMTPVEFQHTVKELRTGVLVYLEPLKRDQALETFGKPAFDHALRQFAQRVRAKLPVGGAICRRHQGDFVVFLPVTNERYATSWANDVAATASMIGIRTPDGSQRLPLAIRAKVAPVDVSADQVVQEAAA
jgi:GGDEF domain-containing protein